MKEAMNDELKALEKNQTWQIADFPNYKLAASG